jgi:hypothetical protein
MRQVKINADGRRPSVTAFRNELNAIRTTHSPKGAVPNLVHGWRVSWREKKSDAMTVRVLASEREAFEFGAALTCGDPIFVECGNRRWERGRDDWRRLPDIDEPEAACWRRIEQDRRAAIEILDAMPPDERLALAADVVARFGGIVPTDTNTSRWSNEQAMATALVAAGQV